MRIYISLLCK